MLLLYAQFLPIAAFMDVELRSLPLLQTTTAEAKASGVKLIASSHFFKSTPSLARLTALRSRASSAGADIFKVAALTRSLGDVLTLAALFVRPSRMRVSAMGMGAFGKLSRLVLARAGSVLNYGYLDAVQVPGQWPATLLKERLAEIA